MRKLYMLCILLLTGILFAQTAEIKIEAMSPHELEEEGIAVERSSGLHVVGVNEIVFLVGKEANDSAVTAYSWSIASAPTGSVATLDSTDTWRTTFRPDVEGQFDINLTITTAQGSDDTTITIYAAKYVGVGTIGGTTPQVPQCGVCHSDKVTEWEGTGHASFFTRAMDGLVSSHYASYCIGCHTVGYNTNADGNDGFDDVAATEGWVFPDTLASGVWDSLLVANPNTMQKANIQCENCHGPGSLHMGNTAKIGMSLDEGLCGQCHEEPPYHVKNLQLEKSGHFAATTLDYAGGRTGCRDCHSGDGFLNSLSGHFPEPMKAKIACATCHDPHDATNEHQVRKIDPVTLGDGTVFDFGMGNLCANCHKGRRVAEEYAVEYHSHYGPHHGPQADVIAGANAIFWGQPVDRVSAHNSSLTIKQDGCVACHMAPGIKDSKGEVVVGEHTFNMSADTAGTPDDPTDDVDNVTACNTCHEPLDGTITKFDDIMARSDYDEDGTTEPFVDEIDGLMEQVALLLPPYDSAVVEMDTTKYSYTVDEYRAAFNYLLIEEDRSHGIHNPDFAVSLLKTTLNVLKGVVGIEHDYTRVPDHFELEQNYPNPFNPSTTIKFGVPHRSEVTLTIYNMLGQVVKTLVNGELDGGYHTYMWDGRDASGNVVPSGTYIYSLKTDQGIISKKMVFIK